MPTSDKLECDPVNLHEIFSADNELWCPLFQRPFVWTRKNIDQLWKDIDTIMDGQFNVRFLGALVFDNDYPSSARKAGLYWIVDGQQRLTTLYLSLLSLVEVAMEISEADTAEEMIDQYLLSRKASSKDKPKLRPTLRDTRQFNSILRAALGDRVVLDIAQQHGPADGDLRSGYEIILQNVRARCSDEKGNVQAANVDQLRSILLDNIEFVEIRLGSNHDPNEVFDRLNKEGERLGIIDLVRNEVLKRLKDMPSTANDLYVLHWQPFEESFHSESQRDRYFFPFALTHEPTVTKPRTFTSLAGRWNKLVGSEDDPTKQLELIMRDLHVHLPAYNAIAAGEKIDELDGGLTEQLRRLNDMNCPRVVYPYIMRLTTEAISEDIDQAKAADCLAIIESFLARRAVVGIEPTGLHAVFKVLWDRAEDDPSEVRKNIETATIAFPKDEEFVLEIKYAPLYRRKIHPYLIRERERSFTAGDLIETYPEITVDHILPQQPEGEWLENFKEVEREKWTDTWANLVPLSQKANSEKGRDSWEETRDKLSNETVFSTTKHLYDDYDEWTPEAIEIRAQMLADWSLERWPMVKS